LVKNTKEENFISKYKEDFKKGIAALESIPENEKLKLNLSDCFAQILEKERESFNSERENSYGSFVNYLKETDDKLETSELKCAFWIVVCHCILFREKPNPFIRNLVREKYDNFDFDNLVSVLECDHGKLLSLFYEISQNKIFRSDKNLLSFLDYRLMISSEDYTVKAIKTNKMTKLSRDYCCVILLEELFYLNIGELSIKDKDDEDILYLDGNFLALVRTLFLSQVEKDPCCYIKEHYFDVEDISPYMVNLFTALTSSNLSLFSEDKKELIKRARIGILPYYPEMNDWPRD
jgi:hypothetical protein